MVAHGEFGFFFSMADYSHANKYIKHVLKLSAISYLAEYYNWEDDMEKFCAVVHLIYICSFSMQDGHFSDVVLS